jgi:hypothetical protein
MAVSLSALRTGRCFTLQKHYFYASGTHFCFAIFWNIALGLTPNITLVSCRLIFDLEDGSDTLLRNYTLYTNYTVLRRRIRQLSAKRKYEKV